MLAGSGVCPNAQAPALWAMVSLGEPGRVRTEFAGLGGAGGAECSRCESGCLAFSPNQRVALPTSHWAATFSPLAGASAQHLHVHLTHSGQSSLRESLRGRGGLSPGPHNARPLFFHSPHPGPIPSRPVLPPPSPSRCLACLCTRGQASLTSCPNYCELLSLLSLRAGPTCSHSGHCWPGGT